MINEHWKKALKEVAEESRATARYVANSGEPLLGKGYDKYIHDFRADWSCSNCGNKWTKPAGDYPAGKWWICCTNCEKKND
jgi:hypothetical protein